MDSIIEYSLNTPTFNDNILNSKIIDMIRRENNLIGGTGDNFMNTSNCMVLIIGIIVIMVGFYLCWNKNDLMTTNAQIQNLSCDTTDFNSQCKFNVIYTVNSIQYSKFITLDKSVAPTSNTITVYYKESDPNIMRLYNFNYSVIGIILVIIGAFILISSICCTNNMNFIPETQGTESNLYTESKNSSGVVYTKN
jgi:uncharacterized membrane protein